MNECVYLANYACYISSGAENTSLAQKEGSNIIAREGTGDDWAGKQIKACQKAKEKKRSVHGSDGDTSPISDQRHEWRGYAKHEQHDSRDGEAREHQQHGVLGGPGPGRTVRGVVAR